MKIQSSRIAAIPLTAITLLWASTEVHAQMIFDAIGQTIGNATAAQNANRECMAGKPVDQSDFVYAEKHAQASIENYFAFAAAGKQSELSELFASSDELPSWTGSNGPAVLTAIKDPFVVTGTSPKPERKDFVVAGDNETARGVWTIAVPKSGDPNVTQHVEYAVDFIHGGWSGWKIWHVQLYREPATAPTLKPYCYFRQVVPDPSVDLSKGTMEGGSASVRKPAQ